MAVVIKVEVVAAKREVAVVKAGVALTKVVIEEVYLDVLNSAPPCRRCCQPQGLVLPMLLPQVLYTAVARAEVGVAKAGVVVVQAEAYASRAKVVVALSFLLPAPPCHQCPPPQTAGKLLLLLQELTTGCAVVAVLLVETRIVTRMIGSAQLMMVESAAPTREYQGSWIHKRTQR